MKLKAVVDAIDAVPEPLREAYVEKDGKFVLDLEGAPTGYVPASDHHALKSSLADFRENNRTLNAEVEQLRPLKEKYKDVDPDEYRELKKQTDELGKKGIRKPDDLTAAITSAVEAATKPIREKLETEERERKAAQARADEAQFEKLVAADATKAGVRPESLRHVIRDAQGVFELKDGKLAPKPGQKHPDDPLKDLAPSDWLTGLSRTDAYLFGESTGSGANPAGPGAKPGARVLLNPTAEEKGKHMKGIADGSIVVKYEQ